MRYSLSTIEEPTEEPISLDEAKVHLRIDHPDEDALIRSWVKAARKYTEDHCGKRWVTQTVQISICSWPGDGVLCLPLEPVQSIESILYDDANGDEQTIADWQEWLDHSPPIIRPERGVIDWPAIDSEGLTPIRIRFVAGYPTREEVPETVKAAMKLILTYWDENRGGESGNNPASRGIPAGALRLLEMEWKGSY